MDAGVVGGRVGRWAHSGFGHVERMAQAPADKYSFPPFSSFYVVLDNQFNLDQTALEDTELWVTRVRGRAGWQWGQGARANSVWAAHRPCQPARPPTPTIPPTQWSELVASLTKAYPEAAALCIADLLNEPDAFGVRWEAQGDKPGAGDLYLAAMDAVHAVNPGMLFMVEGCGQNGLAQNWGDGLATDPALVSERGLSDPNPFFTGLLAKPYAGQVVVGPHVYPPSVTHSTYAIQART